MPFTSKADQSEQRQPSSNWKEDSASEVGGNGCLEDNYYSWFLNGLGYVALETYFLSNNNELKVLWLVYSMASYRQVERNIGEVYLVSQASLKGANHEVNHFAFKPENC